MATSDPGLDRYFPSKRDWWLVLLIWVAVFIGLVGGMSPVFVEDGPVTPKLFILMVCLGMDGLMLWVLYGTGYFLTKDQLLIRCGPFRFRVSLQEINSMTPTRSLLSSPACSLDRLRITYRDSSKTIMVSPNDKRRFLSAVVQRCPTLMLFNDRIMKKKEVNPPLPSNRLNPQSIS